VANGASQTRPCSSQGKPLARRMSGFACVPLAFKPGLGGRRLRPLRNKCLGGWGVRARLEAIKAPLRAGEVPLRSLNIQLRPGEIPLRPGKT
jgi:hypothetical protein